MGQDKNQSFTITKGNFSNYTPVVLNGIFQTKVIDTVYSTENNIPVRTIKTLYTMKDSTKYTEEYTTEWNDKHRNWEFNSVIFQKGEPKKYTTTINGIWSNPLFTPTY